MSTPPYMKLYWGDYYRGTRHLRTPAEHGAYLLLIGALWDAGGKLAADDAILARHALCSAAEWAAMKEVILPFFKVSRGHITHKRVGEELSKYDDTVRKRKMAGKAGGKASRGNHSENAEANAYQDDSISRHNQNQNQNHKEKKEVEAAEPEVRREASPARGSRLADDWTPSAENVAYAMRLGFSHVEVERLAERFRNFWLSKAGRDAAKLDWSRTWQNWASTEAERRPKAANGTTGRVDWV